MSILSKRLNSFKPSLTVKISQKARELELSGKSIISLSSGEPDFDTPYHIKNEGINAIKSGFTKYTSVDGVPELKQAIKNKFLIENDLNYSINQITVGAGGKHVIYNLLMATLNPGDEVIIPSPYWVSYPDIVSLAEGTPVIINTSVNRKFKINPDDLEEKINKNTKWIILNSPSNPTGSCYTEKELKEISKVLLSHDHVNILSDDIYEHLIYGNFKFKNILNVEPELIGRTFIVNGVSKAFSMTGWRIGYGAGSCEIIRAISKIQSQSTTNPSSISQFAAIGALNSEKLFLIEWIEQFKERRDFVVKRFNDIPGLSCIEPDGAFYVFVSCKKLIGSKNTNGNKISNDLDFCDFLLNSASVAVVPGLAFGMSPYFRVSYASSKELLIEACKKIEESIKLLK